MPHDSNVKLCECGCGRTAPIATSSRRGYRKGEPQRFILGHARMVGGHTQETKAKIAAAGRGRTPTAETRAKISASKVGLTHSAETRAKISAKNKLRPKRFGVDAPGWKNGRTVVRGRVLIYVGRDHPMATGTGYVYEHRLVAARKVGRMLGVHEHVHHIDLDPLNNSPENLVVVSRSQHMSIHRYIEGGMDPCEAVKFVRGEASP